MTIGPDTEFGGVVCKECGWSLVFKSPGQPGGFETNKAEHLPCRGDVGNQEE